MANGIRENDLLSSEFKPGSVTGRQILSKVPEITVLFWIIKILTTGMGEAAADYLSHDLLDQGLATILLGSILVISLALQLKARKYTTWIYWLNIAIISVFGTMVADDLHIGPVASTIIFAGLLATILITWYVSEKTLSIHSIYTQRREVFYWATVMATFALGTAAGDMTAFSLHLGTLLSGIMFVGLIAIPAIGHLLFGMNEIFAFWFAYITTRPLGASFADWIDGPTRFGGLGIEKGPLSLVLTIIIIGLVIYMGVKHLDVKDTKNDLEKLQLKSSFK